jgi:hypothetical protein
MKISRKCAVPSAKNGASEGKPTARSNRNLEQFPDTLGKVVIHRGRVLKPAAALYAAQGTEAAIAFLGSRAKFFVLAPKIVAQVKFWERAEKRLAELTKLRMAAQPEAA